MPNTNYYKKGFWNFICQVCGQRYKSSELRINWDGTKVCPKDFELRHPQDFIRGVRDNQTVSVSSPEPPDQFVGYCQPLNSCSIVDYGQVGCLVVDKVLPPNFNTYE